MLMRDSMKSQNVSTVSPQSGSSTQVSGAGQASSQQNQTKAGQSKGASQKSAAKSSGIRPDVVSVDGTQGVPITRDGSGILIHDGGLTQAYPVGGNLYRSSDGRTWSVNASGLTAHPVMTPSADVNYGQGYSSGSTDFGGGGGEIGTGIGILIIGVPVFLAFIAMCFLVCYVLGIVILLGLAGLMAFIAIEIEAILILCYQGLRDGTGDTN